jgi:two-component sensor histidine kinase
MAAPARPVSGVPLAAASADDEAARLAGDRAVAYELEPLAELRDRAERQLNAVRAAVLGLLATASLAYAPALTPALRLVNVSILVPTLAWTLGQYLRWYTRRRLPGWLTIANPIVDITAVTASMAGYGLTQSAALALKSPMFLAYFVILAARPVASSGRRAAAMAALTVVEYAVLLGFFVMSHRVALTASPLAAVEGTGVSPLDEGAKLLLLAVAGAIATYATAWHERLVVAYSRSARERERLEVRLTRAQLESLKHQLQPHFLFNALNAITALIPTDARAAQRTVHGLSELLRLSLHSSGDHEVRLDRELEILGHYLDIQRIRFQDRLTVRLSVDPDARHALVPNLLLQPLVENAIRHGIGPRAAGGAIDVEASCDGDRLHLRVADDGVGARLGPAGALAREGVGLANTRARLQHLYGERQRLAVSTAPGAGFVVDIDLPLRV